MPGWSDMICTYYDYVQRRITVGDPDKNLAPINPARVFAGITQAEQWPPKAPAVDAFYLTVLNQFPAKSVGRKSRNNLYYRSVLQWQWICSGTNLQAGQIGANRGDRFPTDQTMRGELVQANFPLFCPLISVSLDPNNNIVRTPYVPAQTCRWTELEFGPRPSVGQDSGNLYGAGAVDVFAFQQPLS